MVANHRSYTRGVLQSFCDLYFSVDLIVTLYTSYFSEVQTVNIRSEEVELSKPTANGTHDPLEKPDLEPTTPDPSCVPEVHITSNSIISANMSKL